MVNRFPVHFYFLRIWVKGRCLVPRGRAPAIGQQNDDLGHIDPTDWSSSLVKQCLPPVAVVETVVVEAVVPGAAVEAAMMVVVVTVVMVMVVVVVVVMVGATCHAHNAWGGRSPTSREHRYQLLEGGLDTILVVCCLPLSVALDPPFCPPPPHRPQESKVNVSEPLWNRTRGGPIHDNNVVFVMWWRLKVLQVSNCGGSGCAYVCVCVYASCDMWCLHYWCWIQPVEVMIQAKSLELPAVAVPLHHLGRAPHRRFWTSKYHIKMNGSTYHIW